ncbi:berberine bridge enzyme-like 26 [Phalaenopsis equestris]|uniref:berberine bridge enzyme-like 26 n=1 Tax=Phalaenopsis equestris TaxID=78828 RepID=UPI0009E4C9D1|nr:berberine bridge enzyme-like 26 [Phalaenopsis equestris]
MASVLCECLRSLIQKDIQDLLIPLFINVLFLLYSSRAINVDQSPNSDECEFVECLRNHSVPPNLYFTPQSHFFNHFFFSSVRNRRPLLNSSKPILIFLPTSENHVQAAVLCSRSLDIPTRTRSGGHDYEGLSYASTSGPFVLIDLQFLSSIKIDMHSGTAWVHAGAIIGELYYAIANHSRTVAFPAGLGPTVGVGGHLSGGGLGTLMRSFGLSSDNVEDIRIGLASGEIKDRGTIGEELFWALRGGGGASFGVIVAYKVRLVAVPSKVTVFTISKNLEGGATKLVDKWQRMAYKVDKRLFIRAVFTVVGNDSESSDGNKTNRTVQVSFKSLFLGEKNELLPIIEDCFPELELKAEDCTEMGSSTLQICGVEEWMRSLKSSSLSSSERNLFSCPLFDAEVVGRRRCNERHVDWLRRFYKFMTPYVSKNPRAAYLNYRDLDIGTNVKGNKTNYWEARVWGERYYKGNFKRLAYAKGEVDPTNMFMNEQSVNE